MVDMKKILSVASEEISGLEAAYNLKHAANTLKREDPSPESDAKVIHSNEKYEHAQMVYVQKLLANKVPETDIVQSTKALENIFSDNEKGLNKYL